MSITVVTGQPVQKLNVNWAKECILGASLGTVFTLMASHSGVVGVDEGSLAAQIHQLMILGGVIITAVCGSAALVLLALQAVRSLAQKTAAALHGNWFGEKPFATLHTVRFLKIFLP